jgi:hypothetical protein
MSYDRALYERVKPADGSRLEELVRTVERAKAKAATLTELAAARTAELAHLRAAAMITATATPTELATAAQARTLLGVYEEALRLIAQMQRDAQVEQSWAENQLQGRLDGLAEAEAIYHASQAANQRAEQANGDAPNAPLTDSQQQLDWLWRQDTGQPYLISTGDGA